MIVKYKSQKYSYNRMGISSKKTIWLNGCFDIIHLEHIRMLNWVKKQFPNHRIIIGLNSDKSIKNMNKKHPQIFDEKYRSEFMQELVEDVIIYDEYYDYLEIIKHIKPDFIVKGQEYQNKDIPEKNLGVNIIYYFSNSETSTTKVYMDIIQKYKNATEI
jgi:cytidyltransferase-like protein